MFAYLDAGTGGVIIAAIAGAFVGIAVYAKRILYRVTAVFSKSRKEELAAAKTAESVGSDD